MDIFEPLWSNQAQTLWTQVGPQGPEDITALTLQRIRRVTALMTAARVDQALVETVAANPSLAARVDQAIAEAIAANPSLAARVSQTIVELVASTAIVRLPSLLRGSAPAEHAEEIALLPWLGGRQVFVATGVPVIAPLRIGTPQEAIEERTIWLQGMNSKQAFAAMPPLFIQSWVNT